MLATIDAIHLQKHGEPNQCKEPLHEQKTSHPINDIIITDWWKPTHTQKNHCHKINFRLTNSLAKFSWTWLMLFLTHSDRGVGWKIFLSPYWFAFFFFCNSQQIMQLNFRFCCSVCQAHWLQCIAIFIFMIPLKTMLCGAHAQSVWTPNRFECSKTHCSRFVNLNFDQNALTILHATNNEQKKIQTNINNNNKNAQNVPILNVRRCVFSSRTYY